MRMDIGAKVLQRPWVGTSMMVALLLGLVQYWRVQHMIRERLSALDAGTVETILWLALIIGPFAFLLAAFTTAVAASAIGHVMDEPGTFRETLAVGCIAEIVRLFVSTIETWLEAVRFERTGILVSPAISDLNMLELAVQGMIRPSALIFAAVLAILAWRGLRWTWPSALTITLLLVMLRAAVNAVRTADPVLRS